MIDADWIPSRSRKIVERIVVKGNLVLETPAHFGGGDAEGPTDMPLLLDPLKGKALLPGTSIAGALRSYLREWMHGYGTREGEKSLVTSLFGCRRSDDEGYQSPLIVDDALSGLPETELRDGVRIDPKYRTAKEEMKFDIELFQAGTTFPLSLELLIIEGQPRDEILTALALALQGLEKGEITLGARKRRGYGRCNVSKWRVQRFDMTQSKGLLAWLTVKQDEPAASVAVSTGSDIAKLLAVEGRMSSCDDQRDRFTLKATFSLDGSLLIRSAMGRHEQSPDMAHLHSFRNDERVPVLSGTSLAGAIRHRGLRIAKTIASDKTKATQLIECMFGTEMAKEKEPRASRVITKETVIEHTNYLVQSRIRIDRFTGGTIEGALFDEAPVFGDKDSRIKVELELQSPKDHEIGLLLLVLKDLWTSDLPLGGESSVGRGRLKGIQATLCKTKPSLSDEWTIKQDDKQLVVHDPQGRLEGFVEALHNYLNRP